MRREDPRDSIFVNLDCNGNIELCYLALELTDPYSSGRTPSRRVDLEFVLALAMTCPREPIGGTLGREDEETRRGKRMYVVARPGRSTGRTRAGIG